MTALKIDKSFVMEMSSQAGNNVIVRSTVDLGRNLGLTVTAEGVEDSAAWRELRALGCDSAQGYLLSRPRPPAALTAWLRDYRASRTAATRARPAGCPPSCAEVRARARAVLEDRHRAAARRRQARDGW